MTLFINGFIIFQSTPPAWGATWIHGEQLSLLNHFNPRPPHGERPHRRMPWPGISFYFNPRPPHGERPTFGASSGGSYEFQSTPPAWGATAKT